MKLFQRLNDWLNEIYSEDDQVTVRKLQQEITLKNFEIKELNSGMDDMELYITTLTNMCDDLEEQLTDLQRHESVEDFLDWLDKNVPFNPKKQDFGKGMMYCRETLLPRTSEKHKKFLAEVLKFDYHSFNNADEMVYKFNLSFNRKYPVSVYYHTDRSTYSLVDYWESPDEAILRLEKRKGGDCDMFGAAKYGLIMTMLEDLFPTQVARLRVFIVETITGEVHYILGWVKDGPNDWIPIETTWYVNSFKRAWNENLPLRDNLAYKILWSFDEDGEYERKKL